MSSRSGAILFTFFTNLTEQIDSRLWYVFFVVNLIELESKIEILLDLSVIIFLLDLVKDSLRFLLFEIFSHFLVFDFCELALGYFISDDFDNYESKVADNKKSNQNNEAKSDLFSNFWLWNPV